MKVIPINNNYKYSSIYAYNTRPIKNVNFNGIFSSSKSLPEKFNDGIAALDENSVFIFSPQRDEKSSKFVFNQNSGKIDIPILKTYTYIASKEELEHPEFDASFAIYKKDEEYYIMDIGGLNGGLRVSQNTDDYDDKDQLKQGEIRRLRKGDKISIHHELFNKSKNIFFEFNPPKAYHPKEAEKYMEVKNLFADKDAMTQFNKATISKFSQPKIKTNSTEKEFTFADVGGLDKQVEELRKYVLRPINYPDVYKNIRLNKGILLYGPPRCGKTLLGKALANEADTKFVYMNSNEFIAGTVGSSEGSVRKAFDGIMQTPTILFIDEFDAIGKKRDGSSNARYQDPVVNQLLGCMSDLEKSYINSFVIAATNRRDLLDEALISTGRFGLHMEIPMPDKTALGSIYDIHSKNQPLESDVSKEQMVDLMLENKFNGSDVAEMFTVGFFNALERLGMNKKMDAKLFQFEDMAKIKVSAKDLTDAITKISKQKVR